MKLLTAILVVAIVTSTALVACSGSPERVRPAAPFARTLVGQLLLPSGTGNRGVEVLIRASESAGPVAWAVLDERGRFDVTLREVPSSLTVTAGPDVHRIDAADLPDADRVGRIDVGVIDLRDRLKEHRLVVRAADGEAPAVVRAGMFFGPPPVGPSGEPVSLGSRQFPELASERDVAWLLPHDARAIYFLVERPSGAGRGRQWRSGRQQLFGPFTSADVPAELVLD